MIQTTRSHTHPHVDLPIIIYRFSFPSMFRLKFSSSVARIASLGLFIGSWVNAAAIDDATTPPPASAYITKLAALPGDDLSLFAATNGGGLYRSDDSGDHWHDISPSPDLRYYNIVVFDPTNSSRLYTGGRDSGLWVSPDRGDSWRLSAFADTSILSLVIHPRDPDHLYVLTPNGVHRSTTGRTGAWTHVFDYPKFVEEQMAVPWPNPDWPVQFGRFQHLTLDHHDPDTLYLGGRWEGGYHRSNDGGDTWHHESIGPLFRRGDRIVVDPTDSRVLYAETHHQGMFKSYNRGRSWVSSSHGIAPPEADTTLRRRFDQRFRVRSPILNNPLCG